MAATNPDTYDTAIVTIEDGVAMSTFTRDDIVIDKTNRTKVCTLTTSDQSKDICLFQNSIYEQIKVTDAFSIR